MPKAEVNGISLYYESHGQGEAIVFAHGAGGNHLSWWQQIPYFSTKYRCVTFDHRGFGASIDVEDGPGANAFPEDLRTLLDTLGIEHAFLVAQSMGGGTCMGFTVAYPERVRALVMCDTIGAIADVSLAETLERERKTRPAATLDTGAYNPTLREQRPDLAHLYDSIRGLNPPRAQANGEREPRYVATTEKLAALKMPTMFIVGSEDALIPPEAIRFASTLIPGAWFAEVPGCGHSVYFEDAPAFNRVLDEFLDSVIRSPAK
jgi:3-oxoadipate enol-lactonase